VYKVRFFRNASRLVLTYWGGGANGDMISIYRVSQHVILPHVSFEVIYFFSVLQSFK